VQVFVSAVSRRVAPPTTETVYAVLRVMMQHAVDDGPQVIPANPCTRIRLPKSRKRVVEPVSPAAVLALTDAITLRYRVAVALGVGLGLREGEAFGLTLPQGGFPVPQSARAVPGQRGQLELTRQDGRLTRWELRHLVQVVDLGIPVEISLSSSPRLACVSHASSIPPESRALSLVVPLPPPRLTQAGDRTGFSGRQPSYDT
jgi:hypothetical protein